MLHIVRLIHAQPITSRCKKPCIANVNKNINVYICLCKLRFLHVCVFVGYWCDADVDWFVYDLANLCHFGWSYSLKTPVGSTCSRGCTYLYMHLFFFAFVIKVMIQFCRCQVVVSLNHCPSATLWQWVPCSYFACLIFFSPFFLCLLFSCFSRFPCFYLVQGVNWLMCSWNK